MWEFWYKGGRKYDSRMAPSYDGCPAEFDHVEEMRRVVFDEHISKGKKVLFFRESTYLSSKIEGDFLLMLCLFKNDPNPDRKVARETAKSTVEKLRGSSFSANVWLPGSHEQTSIPFDQLFTSDGGVTY